MRFPRHFRVVNNRRIHSSPRRTVTEQPRSLSLTQTHTCLVTSCVLISSMAELALRLASNSRAALAARSNPSGSNPVTLLPPPLFLAAAGGLSGVMTVERDSPPRLLLLLPRPPNMVMMIQIVCWRLDRIVVAA